MLHQKCIKAGFGGFVLTAYHLNFIAPLSWQIKENIYIIIIDEYFAKKPPPQTVKVGSYRI